MPPRPSCWGATNASLRWMRAGAALSATLGGARQDQGVAPDDSDDKLGGHAYMVTIYYLV